MAEHFRISDEDLMAKFQSGDNLAFDELVRRYKQPLANFIFRFLSDYDDSLDIVQDTFIRVYQNKENYKTIAKFSTWLYTIASNLAKTHLRRRKRFKLFSSNIFKSKDEEFEVEYPDTDPTPEENTERNLRAELVQEALSKLSEHYREVVVLRDIMELSYEEISKITRLPEGTVKSRINRGRLILKGYLSSNSKEF
jgi:RNA polymerase sigma-70 factor (ECF subfamily)